MVKKQAELTNMFDKQRKQLQDEVVDLSTQVARKALQEYLDPKTQTSILESQLKKIAKMKV